MSGRLDLKNHVFGKLTVLEPAPNIGKRTAWLCQCECGNKIVVQTKFLRNGHVVSCGCKKKSSEGRMHYIDGTCIELLQMKTVRKNNQSGTPGIFWSPHEQRWRAQIGFKGKSYTLGRFSRKSDAIKARKNAEEHLHGEFLEWYQKNIKKQKAGTDKD